jgi:hypothetical protein
MKRGRFTKYEKGIVKRKAPTIKWKLFLAPLPGEAEERLNFTNIHPSSLSKYP